MFGQRNLAEDIAGSKEEKKISIAVLYVYVLYSLIIYEIVILLEVIPGIAYITVLDACPCRELPIILTS